MQVGVFSENDYLKVIPNDLSNLSQPTLIAFKDMHRLVGEEAYLESKFNPSNSVCDLKSLLAANPKSEHFKQLLSQWPFAVQCEENNLKSVAVQLGSRQ